MGPMRLIGLMWLMCLIGLMGSCTSDMVQSVAEPEPEQQQVEEEEQGVPIGLECYVRDYGVYEPDEANGAKGMTRAEPSWMPSGYSTFIGTGSKAIGAFFTADSPAESKEKKRIWFHTDENKWYIEGKEITTGDFYIYGYMPFNAADVDVSPNTVGGDTSYEKGAIMTFNDMKSVMTKDICVIVGASHGYKTSTDPPEILPANPPADLAIGKFGLCNMKSGEGSGNENYLFLLCEHLYARLEFKFRVDNSAPYYYASLRTIKLRKVELTGYTYTLSNLSDKKVMKDKGNFTVNLVANNTGSSPVDGSILFTPDPTSDNMSPELLFESEEGEPLPKSTDKYPEDYVDVSLRGKDKYTIETGYVPYFNLSGSTKVCYVLRSTYDVYDKKGNLVRQNCVAENLIVPNERFNQAQLYRGEKYELQLTVMPTYLYQLSEPDLDNPGMVTN